MKTIMGVLLLYLSFSAGATKESLVDISIVKSNEGIWTVTYKTGKPASRLSFNRNPDASRIPRWRPINPDFEIVLLENKEYLVKKDGSEFEQVSLQLTPTYKHLAKDYAPFSPYSDGGVLIYTGRLFACIDVCDTKVNQWLFSMQIPEGEHMLVRGEVLTGTASWIDGDDGMNIYVGTQQPVETQNVVAIIDRGLPEKIQSSLNSDIPKLMNYFEQRLGKLEGVKPTLFASYANIDGHSSQGGTLSDQIFMHWNLAKLDKKVKDNTFLNNTLWFFAHEVAHLYQRGSKENSYGKSHEAWLHEGHAEWLAALVLLELYPDKQAYVTTKVDRFKAECGKGLIDFPLAQAAAKGRFDLYYSCGFLIHQAIDQQLREKGEKNIYSLWLEFRNQAEKGNKKDGQKGSELFLFLTKKWTSSEFASRIKQVVESKLRRPEHTLNQLLTVQ
ncbi:hypothetical protein IT774_00670 [Salinimonas marina]|uniref:Uncharacterized protein n=1 Tax=Salinimonas marina TaxID=2785918 RepID=A0A7S9DYU4_9ALTE|nr:hypothetical protein [Salinimonas marina]QPG05830.1 hypothetical protein IT774_00670 [Salinimonas marina]